MTTLQCDESSSTVGAPAAWREESTSNRAFAHRHEGGGCGCPQAVPHPPRTAGGRSGVVQEPDLAGLAVRRVAEPGERLVGAVVVLVELVDLAGFLAGGHG